jgi:hypothetical protein
VYGRPHTSDRSAGASRSRADAHVTSASEISAIASAVAAVAAWAAVAQATREQRQRRKPHLFIQSSNALLPGGSSFIRLRVENGGEGVAREVWFYSRSGDTVCVSGLPPHGVLAGRSGVTLNTHLASSKGRFQEAVAICRIGNRMHAWDAAGRHTSRTLRFPKLRPFSNDTFVRHFYPEAPELETLTVVGYEPVDAISASAYGL